MIQRYSEQILYALIAFAILLLIVLLAVPAHAGHPCRVVHPVYHAAYVQPIVQNVFYQVGQEVRLEAIVEKKLRSDPEFQAFQQFKAWKSIANGQPVAPSADDGSPALTIKTRCAACHSGQNAKGGITLDGTQAVDDATFRAFSRMYLTGADVPKAMQPLMGKLSADEGSAILGELLRLEAVKSPAEEEGTLK